MAKFKPFLPMAIALLAINLAQGDQSCSTTANLSYASFNMDTYKKSYQGQVTIPYKTAVNTIANDIIEYLAKIPVPKLAGQVKMVAITLKIQAEEFSGRLNSASNSSDTLRGSVDREVEDLASKGSVFQKQLQCIQEALNPISQQISLTKQQIGWAENEIDQNKKGVEEAKKAPVPYKEECHENPAGCTTHVSPIGPPIYCWPRRTVCTKHKDYDAHNNNVESAQSTLQFSQDKLSQLQNSLITYNSNLHSLESKKRNMNDHLAQLNQLSDTVTGLDTNLKKFVSQIRTLFVESKVLAEVIKELIDMETVIDPLNSIADQILLFTPNAADTTYLSAMKQKIAVNLPLVKAKLSQYEMVPVKVW